MDSPPVRDPLAADHEQELVAALKAGDEAAFTELVDRYQASLVRLARMYVRDQATAEEVAQETWLAVLNGIDRFEGRSSLKTWIFRILMNRARTRGQRDARIVPFSSIGDADEPAVDPDRFQGADGQHPGGWSRFPAPWEGDPEERLLAGEARQLILDTIEGLPPNQRAVITLRDIEGFTPQEIRNVLDVSDTNQRVLLHRARSKVRAALEKYLEADR
jgi:RNA polymerase sigma-70 factor (ECF subfamily)